MHPVSRVAFCNPAERVYRSADRHILADLRRAGNIAGVLALIVRQPCIDRQTAGIHLIRKILRPRQRAVTRIADERIDIHEVELFARSLGLIDQVLIAADHLLGRRRIAIRTDRRTVIPILQIRQLRMENVVGADLDEDLLHAGNLQRIVLEAGNQRFPFQRALLFAGAVLQQLVALDGRGDD